MKRQPAHGSSLLEKRHPSVLSWNVHTPINPWLICIGNQVEELVFGWQLYSKLMTMSYRWCCRPEFFMKVHPCWGSGSSHVDVAGGLGIECDWPSFITIPLMESKPSSILLCQVVKNLLAIQETQVPSLSQEDPLEEEGMATHSSVLAWRTPWTVPEVTWLTL